MLLMIMARSFTCFLLSLCFLVDAADAAAAAVDAAVVAVINSQALCQ